jgi:hypothetical protein
MGLGIGMFVLSKDMVLSSQLTSMSDVSNLLIATVFIYCVGGAAVAVL